MDSRLIFLHYCETVITNGGTGCDGPSLKRIWVPKASQSVQANPHRRYYVSRGKVCRKADNLVPRMLPGKTSREVLQYPYRKPTQVDG
jgi:hypothetical protein